jgi:hypothetical protein
MSGKMDGFCLVLILLWPFPLELCHCAKKVWASTHGKAHVERTEASLDSSQHWLAELTCVKKSLEPKFRYFQCVDLKLFSRGIWHVQQRQEISTVAHGDWFLATESVSRINEMKCPPQAFVSPVAAIFWEALETSVGGTQFEEVGHWGHIFEDFTWSPVPTLFLLPVCHGVTGLLLCMLPLPWCSASPRSTSPSCTMPGPVSRPFSHWPVGLLTVLWELWWYHQSTQGLRCQQWSLQGLQQHSCTLWGLLLFTCLFSPLGSGHFYNVLYNLLRTWARRKEYLRPMTMLNTIFQSLIHAQFKSTFS